MPPLNQSIRYALVKCMAIKKSDSVLIITDRFKESLARVFCEEASRLSDFVDIISIPVGRVSGTEALRSVARKMLEFDVILIITKRSLSHTKARKNASEHGARIASMPGITEAIISRSFKVNYGRIRKITDSLALVMKRSDIVRVTTSKGTDLSFSIKKRKLGLDYGLYDRRSLWGNLPAGEFYVAPIERTASGTLVIDKSIAGIGKLKKPVIVRIRKGFAVRFSGGYNAIKFRSMLAGAGRLGFNVAEFGIGTNPQARVTGNVLEDEKVKGTIHIAFGNNAGFGGKVSVPVHLDGVVSRPTVYVDGNLIIEKGRFLIK